MMEVGEKVIWDPCDESEESYILGDILFGVQQHKIREACRKDPWPRIIGTVTKVDQANRVVTIDMRPNE